jgi:hypothetical protein
MSWILLEVLWAQEISPLLSGETFLSTEGEGGQRVLLLAKSS